MSTQRNMRILERTPRPRFTGAEVALFAGLFIVLVLLFVGVLGGVAYAIRCLS